MKRFLAILLHCIIFAQTPGIIFAQSQEDISRFPPRILTGELALETILESETIEVDFVIVDTDTITEISIDGEPQVFKPGPTVLITKKFVFTEPVSYVRVAAMDKAGNLREITYTVYLPEVDLESLRRREEFEYFVNYDMRFVGDDNLTKNPSSGTVVNKKISDTRLQLALNGGIAFGPWDVFIGSYKIDYSKAANELYNVDAIYLGTGYRLDRSDTTAFEIRYLWTELHLAKTNYARSHMVSPGYRTKVPSQDGGSILTLYGLDITLKDFSDEGQDDASVFRLKWNRVSLDAEKLVSFESLVTLGTESDGTGDTDFRYVAFDLDWKRKWESGWLFNIGFGWEFRDFENDQQVGTIPQLDDSRIDRPFRFSTGIGYEFIPKLKVMFLYSHLANVPDKPAYVRRIYGINLSGKF